MNDNTRIIKTDEEIKIFTDPYRLKIVDTFAKNEEPMTVKGVADKMGEVPAKVHYHVKKLLSINIIELDHVTVINGINAKYYKLVADDFRIELADSLFGNKHTSQINNVESVLINTIDGFKNEVLKKTEQVKREKQRDIYAGLISGNDIYLSNDDYKELGDEISRILNKYSKKGEGKELYSILMGYIKKVD